jgi:hypothetical protein
MVKRAYAALLFLLPIYLAVQLFLWHESPGPTNECGAACPLYFPGGQVRITCCSTSGKQNMGNRAVSDQDCSQVERGGKPYLFGGVRPNCSRCPGQEDSHDTHFCHFRGGGWGGHVCADWLQTVKTS